MWKCLISCSMEDVNKRRQIFLSHLNLSEVPRNSIPGKFADNWHFQRIGINTTKFKKRDFILRVTFLLPSPSLMRKLANNYNGGRSEDPVTQPNQVTNFSSDVMLKSEKPLGTRLRLTCDAFFHTFYCSYGITVRPALLSSNKLDTMDLHLLLIGIQKRRIG